MGCSYYDSPLGKIKIEEQDSYIVGINFVNDKDLINKEINIEKENNYHCKVRRLT